MEVRAVPTSYLLTGTWLNPHAVGLGRHILGGWMEKVAPAPVTVLGARVAHTPTLR